ncbi:MAG: DUF4367 domain-containing protein [Firmicutes bacterium]|nr:DUF4367 domain-containing protein [Bacillota bacterium]
MLPTTNTLSLEPGELVKTALRPLKPLTDEGEAYNQLKKATNFPILRPGYLPPGFKVAPYIIDAYGKPTANPDVIELTVRYVRGDDRIDFSIGERGDFGEAKVEKVTIRGYPGRFDYRITDGKPCGILVWTEKANGEEVNYVLNFTGVSKDEIIKMAQSMRNLHEN